MDKKQYELEKALRSFLTLGINGEYYTHTNPAIIARHLVKLFDLPVVRHSSIECEKTYWVNYDNKWQPVEAHYPFRDFVLYFKFLNGMVVACDQVPEADIKPLDYYA